MSIESCGVCGGDGRIANSFSGSTATCPGCHGTGRRSDDALFRDVTKTKPSHYRQANKPAAVEKPSGPATFEGTQLAKEVSECPNLSSGTKAKLTLEIVEHEATHGKCTQTFIKKVRKQLRAAGS
ncbi:MAG: molecular chaperone DnaJ [Polyangiaceae bacterium]|nr:molecular chaperone DnaJ [Polyangiaceae bacterium]NUO83034.1 molecular chaperone DnaJ [candidate division KSB1 bacterium]